MLRLGRAMPDATSYAGPGAIAAWLRPRLIYEEVSNCRVSTVVTQLTRDKAAYSSRPEPP